MTETDFPTRLRLARENKKISQDQLGDMLGVTQQAVNHWEIGKNLPGKKRLEKLEQILGVSPDDNPTLNALLRLKPKTLKIPVGADITPFGLAPTIYRGDFQEELRYGLPANLHQHCDAEVSYGARKYGVDYLSPRLMLEIAGGPQTEMQLLRLITAHRIAPGGAERRTVLAILLPNAPAFSATDLVTDASVHGIEVIFCPTFDHLAEFITEVEV